MHLKSRGLKSKWLNEVCVTKYYYIYLMILDNEISRSYSSNPAGRPACLNFAPFPHTSMTGCRSCYACHRWAARLPIVTVGSRARAWERQPTWKCACIRARTRALIDFTGFIVCNTTFGPRSIFLCYCAPTTAVRRDIRFSAVIPLVWVRHISSDTGYVLRTRDFKLYFYTLFPLRLRSLAPTLIIERLWHVFDYCPFCGHLVNLLSGATPPFPVVSGTRVSDGTLGHTNWR